MNSPLSCCLLQELVKEMVDMDIELMKKNPNAWDQTWARSSPSKHSRLHSTETSGGPTLAFYYFTTLSFVNCFILLLLLFLGLHNMKNEGGWRFYFFLLILIFLFFLLIFSGKLRVFINYLLRQIFWDNEAFTINAVLLHDISIVLILCASMSACVRARLARFGFPGFLFAHWTLVFNRKSFFPIPEIFLFIRLRFMELF